MIYAGNAWDDYVDLPETQYFIHHWWIFLVFFIIALVIIWMDR